ncbi:concanavalin A-like lectin/glucanase domain-containing protein [Emericellopsis atlantica]|uniref:Concanavalin A-like lectin/glucanase domain-containing protein n=1 Tax=Emericellopsis atlantica TaxID=2614577 RepID=A0A9P7ZT93_9HYPO|nr:concanavalin A-like lectin/glucanase domain-containing protein [Emericellopsis atlantica]KAG9257223.1 concanavalin A-like lectin/glucanase domain-containing protein [Emericellopsis atlantica]
MATRLALAAIMLTIVGAKDEPQPFNQSDCGCYLINGSVPTYYAQRMFFDFRDLEASVNVPDPLDSVAANSNASASSDYFESEDFLDVWDLQGWSRQVGRTITMVYSPSNVYIEAKDDDEDDDATSDTFLTMRTKRFPKFQSAAEIRSNSDYFYVSLRMLARTIGAPGAVTAMFTYRDAKELANVQESDIEILTEGPRNKIQYTNQPSYSDDGDDFPEATRNASTPGNRPWSEWMVHRMDWTPDMVLWYVDGAETAKIEFQTPTDPCRVIFNAWGNGGSWSGNMSVHDEAYLQIQWIEMIYNTTDDVEASRKRSALSVRDDDDEGCAAVCSIDDSAEAGEVMLLWDNGAPRMAGWVGATWAVSFAAVALIVLAW